MKNTDNLIYKLYMGQLYPMEEIYNQLNNDNLEFKALQKKANEIETRLKQSCNTEFLEEYDDIHTKIEHIISMHSFEYGIKLGIQLANL